jgi:hypothetical protein
MFNLFVRVRNKIESRRNALMAARNANSSENKRMGGAVPFQSHTHKRRSAWPFPR